MWIFCTSTITGKPIAKGCSAVVYAAKLKQPSSEFAKGAGQKEGKEYPFAIKMMFNYHAESNAFTILRAMQRYRTPISCQTDFYFCF
jgi:PTEN induced putative kinase 1